MSAAYDFRHALWSIRRSPVFSIIVVVTLALAIGANTALFSVLRASALPMFGVARSIVVLSRENDHGTPLKDLRSGVENYHRSRTVCRKTDRTMRLTLKGGLPWQSSGLVLRRPRS
jgi:hypothetical protein